MPSIPTIDASISGKPWDPKGGAGLTAMQCAELEQCFIQIWNERAMPLDRPRLTQYWYEAVLHFIDQSGYEVRLKKTVDKI